MPNVIILAGAGPIKNTTVFSNKAVLRINGKTMIEYVIDAVKAAEGIDKIVVTGPKSELQELLCDRVDAVINAEGTIMANVMAGIRYLGYDENLLICSSDIPLITCEAINDFIYRSQELEADLCYPIVEKTLNAAKFPEIERTYIKIKDGAFTGGNIFYVNPRIIERWYALADKLLEARKKPLKMAGLLSFNFMAQLLMGTLTIEKLENRFSKLFKIKAKAIISEYPELGNDVDKASDVIVAAAYLSK